MVDVVCKTKDDNRASDIDKDQLLRVLGPRLSHHGRSRSWSDNLSEAANLMTDLKDVCGTSDPSSEQHDKETDFKIQIDGDDIAAEKATKGSDNVVLDSVTVKTGMKLRSRFKASWKEGSGGVTQSEQVLQLLEKLKDAVDRGVGAEVSKAVVVVGENSKC